MRNFAAFVATCCALGALGGTSGASPLRYPPTTSTMLGSVRLTTQPDDDARLSGVQVFLSGGLERQTAATNGVAALVAECVLRTPVLAADSRPLRPVRDAIAAAGGSIGYDLDETTVHYYVESLPERMPAVLALLAQGLSAPDFSSSTVSSARGVLLARVAESEKNPFRVGLEMFKESFLQAGLAYPDFGTAASLSALGASSLRAFYAQTYRRGAMSASATGRITPGIVTAVGRLAERLPAGDVAPLRAAVRPLHPTPTRIISQRDVGRPFVVVGFAAPNAAQRDFGPMLVIEELLSDAFERPSATTLSSSARSVGALYLYDSSPASLVVYVNGGAGVDPSTALREILLVAKSLGSKPLGAAALRRLRAATLGRFITNTTSLSDRAYLIGMLASTGTPGRSINGALDAIEATSAADVERAARTYLQRYIVALVLPRQATAPE